MAPPALDIDPLEEATATNHHKANGNGLPSGDTRNGVTSVEDLFTKDAAALLDPFYKITEQPIGSRRPIRVACMGSGYSGLMMGIIFSQKMKDKNAELVIYERNEDLGGTWLENRYLPAHSSDYSSC